MNAIQSISRLLTLALLCAGATSSTVWGQDRPPNVVVIFVDDQGYNDIGVYGSPLIETPHLDRMASEGMRFTSFYSASAVCTPSRAALLTGTYAQRIEMPGVLFPHHRRGLNPDEITIAELLKQKRYATACIGKWHLGHEPPFLPTRQGFDWYYGIPYSNDMYLDSKMKMASDVVFREGITRDEAVYGAPSRNLVPLMRNEEVIEYPADQALLTKRYTEKAVQFIEANQKKPFFLYLAHTMPHVPLYASEAFKGKSKRGLYGDTIEEIDWSVGEILDTLDELSLDENTLVVYASDNGPWKLNEGRGGSAYPLRGYKFQTLEGGMRVPCIMRWPGSIPAGSECDEVAATIDLFPTIAGLTGTDAPSDRVIDGHDIWPLMSAQPGAASPHDAYFFYRANNLEAVRSGDWKLRVTEADGIELFDLSEDITESENLADENPRIVTIMQALMASFDAELKANQRPAGTL